MNPTQDDNADSTGRTVEEQQGQPTTPVTAFSDEKRQQEQLSTAVTVFDDEEPSEQQSTAVTAFDGEEATLVQDMMDYYMGKDYVRHFFV